MDVMTGGCGRSAANPAQAPKASSSPTPTRSARRGHGDGRDGCRAAAVAAHGSSTGSRTRSVAIEGMLRRVLGLRRGAPAVAEAFAGGGCRR